MAPSCLILISSFSIVYVVMSQSNPGRCGPDFDNAQCSPDNCCSEYGYCGNTPAHCKPRQSAGSAILPVPGGLAPPRLDGRCGPAFDSASCIIGNCCSKFGFCGNTPVHCDSQSIYPVFKTATPSTSPVTKPPAPGSNPVLPPATKSAAASPSPQQSTGAPTTAAQPCGLQLPSCAPGNCCSQWGFCGSSPDHCNDRSIYPLVPFPTPPPTIRGDGRCGKDYDGAACPTGQCCSQFSFCGVGPQFCTSAPSISSSSIQTLFTRSMFDSLVNTNPSCEGRSIYTYDAFIRAASSFPKFGNEGSLDARKRDIAGFFGNAMHESLQFCYINELAPTTPATYCSASPTWPCYPGANYHGRGPFQLSWNYNYILFGQTLSQAQAKAIFETPDALSADGELLFRAALWFYMTPQPPKQAMHSVMITDVPRFGESINIINGGLECNGGNPAQVQSRITNYQRVCKLLGTDPGTSLTC